MADKFRYSFDLTKKLEEQLQQSMLASGQQAVTSSPGMMSADPPAKELQEAEQSKYDPYSFIQEYKDMLFSMFGGEEEYNKVINETADTAEAYKDRLKEVEKLVIPFFTKLLKTADKEYIYWPNRKPMIEAQIQKILTLTRD